MVQKYYPEHSEKKFENIKSLNLWLKKTAAKKIYFKDNGQDLLECWIDNGGEILNCNLQSQGFIWNGKIVDLNRLGIGKNIGLMDSDNQQTILYDFIVEKIEVL